MLTTPDLAPKITLHDSKGNPVIIGTGRKMLLAFFRDTNCPFCNFRVFQLTQQHQALSDAGLDVVAFFSSTPEEVVTFLRRRARPFPIVADPDNIAYLSYGVQKGTFTGKVNSVFTRFTEWLFGLKATGLSGSLQGVGGINTNNILPADFLIDEKGYLVETYYGEDIGDHIPLERIWEFVSGKEMSVTSVKDKKN